LSVEQRTRIRETVLSQSNVPRVDNLNVRVSVGTTVPARVRVAPLPREIVEIRPQFRNHQFFVVQDEIVILDNHRRIVEVIPVESAGGSGPAVRGSGNRTDVVVDLSQDEIREVQRVLVQRGFSVEVDGRLGPRTQQALIQFQRREGLQATGRIDSRTISSLGVSVRSTQSGGGQQPSTTGQGDGANQGSGAARQPSPPNQDAGEQSRSPQGNQSGAGQQGKQSGAGQQGRQNQSPSSTTGQGGGSNQQNPPAKERSGAGQQGGASNPAAKQAPSGGSTGTAGNSSSSSQPK
jgi:peptidoglycan hydrolase-like protein with peptidoglycan-binding domain